MDEESGRNWILQLLFGIVMFLRWCIAIAVAAVLWVLAPKDSTVYFGERTLVMFMKLTWLERAGFLLPVVLLALGLVLWARGILHS